MVAETKYTMTVREIEEKMDTLNQSERIPIVAGLISILSPPSHDCLHIFNRTWNYGLSYETYVAVQNDVIRACLEREMTAPGLERLRRMCQITPDRITWDTPVEIPLDLSTIDLTLIIKKEDF